MRAVRGDDVVFGLHVAGAVLLLAYVAMDGPPMLMAASAAMYAAGIVGFLRVMMRRVDEGEA